MEFCQATMTGYLGGDPELSYTVAGTAVTKFSLAVNRRGPDGEDVCDWYKVVVWGRAAETAHQYLHKGDRALVSGDLQLSEWTDRNGTPRTTVQVHVRGVNGVVFLSSKADRSDGSKGGDRPEPDWSNDEDDPFGDQ
ncbi:MAG: single-stranded DNA-binding protein [Armatimonadota bacterium]